MASEITVEKRAIYKLLFRENVISEFFDWLKTLKRSSGWEGPARSALSLVFDISYSSLFSPVNWAWESSSRQKNFIVRFFQFRFECQVKLFEFFNSHLSKLIQFHGESFKRVGVVGFNFKVVLVKSSNFRIIKVGFKYSVFLLPSSIHIMDFRRNSSDISSRTVILHQKQTIC